MVSEENIYGYTNLVDLVFSHSHRVKNSHPLYIDAATDENITYGDFKTLVRQATFGFKRIGINRGDSVCIFIPDGIHVPSLVLGTIAAGGNVNLANPGLDEHGLQNQLTLTKSKYLVAPPCGLDTALAAAKLASMPLSNVWSIIKDPEDRAPDWKSVLVNGQEEADPIKLTVEESKKELAYTFFTSGTTGATKGVMISHFSVIASTIETCRLTTEDKSYSIGPLLGIISMFRVMGLFQAVHITLYLGKSIVLITKFDLKQMCHMIQKHCISTLYVTPSLLSALIDYPQIADQFDLSSLQLFYCAASHLSESLANAIQQKFNIPIYQCYGATETAAALTIQTAENYVPNSVGRVIGGVEVKVVDDNGKDLPAGEIGEILAKGPSIMLDYHNHPSAIDPNGYYHTGDLGYVDSLGNWYIIGRSLDMITHNSVRFSSIELDDILADCPLVFDAAAIGVYDEKRKTEVARAYVALNPSTIEKMTEQEITDEIHAFVNSRVVDYKQLHGGIEFIKVLPRTPSRKVIRGALKEMYRQRLASSQPQL